MLVARSAFPLLVLASCLAVGCPADEPEGGEHTTAGSDDDAGSDSGSDSGDAGSSGSGDDSGTDDAPTDDGEPCAPNGGQGPCCSGIAVDDVCCSNFGQPCEAGECCFGECDEVTGMCPAAPTCGLLGESCLEQDCCGDLACSDEGCVLACAVAGESCIETGCCQGLTCDGESSSCIATTECAAEGDWCGGEHECCEDDTLLYCDRTIARCALQPK